jgi:hypothetical protein
MVQATYPSPTGVEVSYGNAYSIQPVARTTQIQTGIPPDHFTVSAPAQATTSIGSGPTDLTSVGPSSAPSAALTGVGSGVLLVVLLLAGYFIWKEA